MTTGAYRSSPFYEIAARFAAQSRFDLAERLLRQALTEAPEHAEAHSLLGICLARLRRFREALVAANEGLRLDPTSAYSHYARALVRAAMDHFIRARQDVEEAIRIDPTLPHQWFLLSAIHVDKRRPRAALAAAENGLQLHPTHTGCASLRALALQRLGRKQEAEIAIAQALLLAPDNDLTHAAQGWRFLKLRDRNRAREHFLEALRINPENRWAQYGLDRVKNDRIVAGIFLTLIFGPAMFMSTLSPAPYRVWAFAGGAGFTCVLIVTAGGLLMIRDSLRYPPR